MLPAARNSNREHARTALLQHLGTNPICRYTNLTMTPNTIVAVYVDRGPGHPRDAAIMHAAHWDQCKAQAILHFGNSAEVFDGRTLFSD